MELLLLMLLADMFKEEEKQEDILEIKFTDGKVMGFPIDHTPEKIDL